MQKLQNTIINQENDFSKTLEMVRRNYKFFLSSIIIALVLTFFLNKFTIPKYEISSSLMIRDDKNSATRNDMSDFLNSSLLGTNRNFQNELWMLKSSPVIEQTVNNLNLTINYFQKKAFYYQDAYETVPFRILFLKNHVQPIHVKFFVSLQNNGNFNLYAADKNVSLYNYEAQKVVAEKTDWTFEYNGKTGKLIETPDMSFILQWDKIRKISKDESSSYCFEFISNQSAVETLKKSIDFGIVDKQATVIQISMKTESLIKGRDIINELMAVYSKQNLDRKNHTASITIDYIENQLNEISESLSETEDNLQSFRSSHQLLNVAEQATGISAQYLDLQNKLAELITRKRYYDYVADYLSKNADFSNMIVPASMGIPDQMLNNLMSELITAQSQRNNLITNKQEKNPLVAKLSIQIENLRKTISDNIKAVQKTTDISIDEMNKRIRKVETEISRLPGTERKLGGIERKYRLNDAIYNYLLEKRAEAKITQASNLPDNIIIEPANMVGTGPILPNKKLNFVVGFILGLGIPFGFLIVKSALNNKIENQESIEHLTELPVLGKIMHNRKKTDNVVFEYPKSNIAESYRTLRTNLEYHFRNNPRKVILITSSLECEGKSFNAMNLAMSYAQLNKRTLLIDFDMRKPTDLFSKEEGSILGLSSYYTERASLEEIITKTPHDLMDYISSGPLPPNPMELLSIGKTNEMMETLKNSYDCIILDTPPLAQVSDAYLLMDYADIHVIVVRQNYTLKKVFAHVMRDLNQKNIENTCIILNDNRFYLDQYGYGYGYNKKHG